MTNTGFKAMNIEELDLVTGGASAAEHYEAIQQAMDTHAPDAALGEFFYEIKDTAERFVSATATLGKQVYNKFTSWF